MRPRARTIAWMLVATIAAVLGLVRAKGGVEPSHVATATFAAPAAAPAAARAPSTPSLAERPAAAPPAAPVVDLAAAARPGPPEPAADRDRFRTNEHFTADDLAHPERYFEAAARMPELRRDEERHDVLGYFLAYRAHLEDELRAAGRDAAKRADLRAVIARYDAAIARLRSALATQAP